MSRLHAFHFSHPPLAVFPHRSGKPAQLLTRLLLRLRYSRAYLATSGHKLHHRKYNQTLTVTIHLAVYQATPPPPRAWSKALSPTPSAAVHTPLQVQPSLVPQAPPLNTGTWLCEMQLVKPPLPLLKEPDSRQRPRRPAFCPRYRPS